MVLFDADYPYPKVNSDFCYPKSIRAILSGVLLEIGNWVVHKYYNIFVLFFQTRCGFHHIFLFIQHAVQISVSFYRISIGHPRDMVTYYPHQQNIVTWVI